MSEKSCKRAEVVQLGREGERLGETRPCLRVVRTVLSLLGSWVRVYVEVDDLVA